MNCKHEAQIVYTYITTPNLRSKTLAYADAFQSVEHRSILTAKPRFFTQNTQLLNGASTRNEISDSRDKL